MYTRLSAHRRSDRGKSAFTLLELLVVVAIIGVLAGLIFPITSTMQKKGRMVRETNAARQLMTAYMTAMSQNDGMLLKGYDKGAQQVTMPSGTTLSGEMCCRYPWRLAPYLSEQIEGMFLINDHKQTAPLAVDSFEYQYRASLNPAFGINAYCIGGYDDGSGSGFFSTDCVTRIGGTSHSAKLIVFATARMKQSGTDEATPGHFLVSPPKLWRTKWTLPFKESSPSSSFGNVDPRWEGRAICALLDGHVEMLDETELTDMRHWSNTAADNDDPNYAVPR